MATKITKEEWDNYHRVQKSGMINMMLHPLVLKFMPDGNWEAAHEWFEETGKTDDLIIKEK